MQLHDLAAKNSIKYKNYLCTYNLKLCEKGSKNAIVKKTLALVKNVNICSVVVLKV